MPAQMQLPQRESKVLNKPKVCQSRQFNFIVIDRVSDNLENRAVHVLNCSPFMNYVRPMHQTLLTQQLQ